MYNLYLKFWNHSSKKLLAIVKITVNALFFTLVIATLVDAGEDTKEKLRRTRLWLIVACPRAAYIPRTIIGCLLINRLPATPMRSLPPDNISFIFFSRSVYLLTWKLKCGKHRALDVYDLFDATGYRLF